MVQRKMNCRLSKSLKWAVYMLYTAIYADIQVWSRKYVAKNIKTEGGGETQVFGGNMYTKNSDIHADIHKVYTKTGFRQKSKNSSELGPKGSPNSISSLLSYI
ncbi:hypothetical protein AABB24_034184 [Solanum stoloniferum]|uniref:Uncharacterized protein n=1 Tax=Solanum stoloniferum TaxID=62892 RepID=A0ABD2REE2_9SOLN